MATCGICSNDVGTYQYVRAKAMVPVEGKARAFTSAPGDEHGFYCLSHGRDAIEEAIASDYKPSEGKPVRVLWNPSKTEWRVGARRQRFTEKVAKLGTSSAEMVEAVIDGSDRAAGVVTRHGNGPGGLRSVTVQDRAGLHLSLKALLMEDE